MARRPIPSAKLIGRALKLQALSASDNPHEAEAAAAQFMRLMREHALTAADLDAATREREDPLVERTCYLDGLRCLKFEERTRYVHALSGWKRSLFGEVAEYFGLRWSYREGSAILTFYGHLSDVEGAVELYEVCARQIDRQAIAHVREKGAEQKRVHGYGFDQAEARDLSRAFRASAIKGLRRKFAELTRESAEDSVTADAHALVLTRRQEVSNWVDATYTFKKASGDDGFVTESHGWCTEGFEAGKNLRLREDDGLEDTAARRRALPGG